MVAEDNMVNQMIVTRVLHKYGIRNITVADNGVQALTHFYANPVEHFDFILME